MNRRDFLRHAAAFTAGGALRGAPAVKPNVVVFYLDDMGYAGPGCYGGKLAPTPHIDALAANGVRFTDGYVTSCVCSPSRVGLITGRYQARTGHDSLTVRPGTELDTGEITMAQYMKRAGYATAIVGKWHLGSGERYLPASRGFDESVGSISNLGEAKFYRGASLVESLPGAPVTTPYYTEEALRYIESHRTRPFFLYLPYNAVHAPHVASEKWMARFANIEGRLRSYAAQTAEADESIGRVMAKLRALKLEENTLVFCISDNGAPVQMASNGPLRSGKWSVYEGGIRVPFLVQWKGKIRPVEMREPVISLDVLPTALAAAGGGVAPEHPLDGINLLPLLQGKRPTAGRELHWRFGPQWAIRRGDWKLVKPLADAQPMLFNVVADPGESKNLAIAEPARVKEMLGLHERWNAQMRPPRWEDRRWNGDWPEAKKKRGGSKSAPR